MSTIYLADNLTQSQMDNFIVQVNEHREKVGTGLLDNPSEMIVSGELPTGIVKVNERGRKEISLNEFLYEMFFRTGL